MHIDFDDLLLGPQHWDLEREVGDFVLYRADGVYAFHLASAVDDGEYGVTDVVRGADLLRSTARQILLQRALQLPTPEYFHCALITDNHGTRLAKRHEALSLRTLRQRGLTPEEVRAMANLPGQSTSFTSPTT
jgi:glutamyl-tRNA synthetase